MWLIILHHDCSSGGNREGLPRGYTAGFTAIACTDASGTHGYAVCCKSVECRTVDITYGYIFCYFPPKGRALSSTNSHRNYSSILSPVRSLALGFSEFSYTSERILNGGDSQLSPTSDTLSKHASIRSTQGGPEPNIINGGPAHLDRVTARVAIWGALAAREARPPSPVSRLESDFTRAIRSVEGQRPARARHSSCGRAPADPLTWTE